MTAFHWGLIFLAVILLLAVADRVIGAAEDERAKRDLGEAVVKYEYRREGISRW